MQNFIAEAVRKAMGVKDPEQHPVASPSDKTQQKGSPLAHMYNNRWNKSTLEYPMDIQQRSDLGHYMMFYVNVPITSKWKEGNAQRSGTYSDKEFNYGIGTKGTAATNATHKTIHRMNRAFSMKSGAGINGDIRQVGRYKNKGEVKFEGRLAFQGQANKQAGKGGKGARTTRTDECIVLYMPPGISSVYGAGWKDVEYGMVGGSAAGMKATEALGGVLSGNTSGTVQSALEGMKGGTEVIGGPHGSRTVETPSKVFEEYTKRKLVGTLGGAAGAGETMTALDKMGNQALNNYVEAVFTGIGFRKFSYSWKFTPRYAEEATMVDTILRTFKFHMLPEYKTNAGRYFTVPAEFDLYYMYRGDENTWLNKINTCVLTNMEVNYTPNTNWQTLRPLKGRNGAPPAEIDMKLDFQETKLITKEDILEGF